MTLIKTSLLNSIAVVIKILTLLGINKVLAIYIGPTGYAAIGQFQNAVQMITTFASGAINTGVTKYTAEYHEDEDRQRLVWQSAGTIALVGSLVTGAAIAILNQQLAIWLLGDAEFGGVFLWFSATLVLFSFNALLLAILNGKREIVSLVMANVSGSVFAFAVTAILAIKYELFGALVALVIYQSISFFITLLLCGRKPWFKINYLVGRIDWPSAKNLGKYTAMALTSAVCVPVSHILIRNHIGETFSWSAAGHWEAMWRLSGAYLMFVTSVLSVYYLPKLSELKSGFEIRNEIIAVYKIVMPAVLVCSLVIYLLRDFIISFLYTEQFHPMRELFAWQMVGDSLKIGSWVLGFVLVARAYTKFVIATEILFSLFFYVSVVVFCSVFGVKGAVMAYALNYFFHVGVMYMILRYKGVFA